MTSPRTSLPVGNCKVECMGVESCERNTFLVTTCLFIVHYSRAHGHRYNTFGKMIPNESKWSISLSFQMCSTKSMHHASDACELQQWAVADQFAHAKQQPVARTYQCEPNNALQAWAQYDASRTVPRWSNVERIFTSLLCGLQLSL